MDDFQMKLHRVKATLRSRDGRDRARRCPSGDMESRRRPIDDVAMAHPNLLRACQPGEHRVRGFRKIERRESVLAMLALPHRAPEQVSHQLLSVTDPQHRNTKVEDC